MAEARIAWLTGATGTWGGAVARALLDAGYDVVALGRHEPPEALRQVAASLGRRLEHVPLDLAVPVPPLEAIAASLPPGLGTTPDVLVHAAVAVEGDRETLARVDYLGPAELIERVGLAMVGRGSGRIGVLVPQNARLGLRGIGDGSAPQGALWTWIESFRAGLPSSSPVTVTVVVPPRAASATQRHLAAATGHHPRLVQPNAGSLVRAVLAGRRRAGRRPWLAAAALLVR